MIELPRPRILDIGSWPEGSNPWDGADVEVFAVPEKTWLSSHTHPETVYHTAYPGCTSMFRPDPDVIDRFSQISTDYNFKVVEIENVNPVQLDSLGHSVDLIKIDVQGAEKMVLTGGPATLEQAVAVQIEVEFLPLYRHQPTAGEVFNFMEEQGFFLHQLRDCGGSPFKPFSTNRPYMPASQLLYADAVFIRWDLQREDKLRLISVLWNVFQSHDLAIHLMSEIDVPTAREMLQLAPSTSSTFITKKADAARNAV